MFHNIKCNYTDKYVMSLFNKKKNRIVLEMAVEKRKRKNFRI